MDCCGEPFSVGDTVEWDCIQSRDEWLDGADYIYEAHGDVDWEYFVVRGVVAKIDKVVGTYQQGQDGVYHLVSWEKKAIEKASVFSTETGFLVVLKNAEVTKDDKKQLI